MENLQSKAMELGATEFGRSKTKSKRFYVVYNKKKINFGLKGGQTFIDHKDKKKRDAWRARHHKIRLKDGSLSYKNKNQASFWSSKILWD